MKKLSQKTGVLGAICGSILVAIPAIPFVARSQVNPCPRIYYEEPYNRAVAVPQGCPPNAVGQPLSNQMTAPMTNRPMNMQGLSVNTPTDRQAEIPATPPLPAARSNAIARVMPSNGTVDVMLKNNTNAIVTFEAISHTQRRYLPARGETVLQNLPTPVTITMVRQDNGLIDVIPVSSNNGMLEIVVEETTNLDDNQGVLRIQEDGQVFLN